MIKFSIVVPIYKVEKYLRQCVESVLNQSFSNFELILVDDGSPDSCPQICDEYARKDWRVRVIHKENGGLPAARNSGIRIATGDYLMHLDGDDFWDEKYLENVAPILEREPRHLYLGNSRFDYTEKKVSKEVLFDVEGIKEKSYDEIIKLFFTGKNKIPTAAWHNIYSLSYLKEKGLYLDENLSWSEDADNFYRCIFSTKDIGFFDYTFYYYRRDNNGAMTKNPSTKHFLSNISVAKRWFYVVRELQMSPQMKKIILSRFANSYIYLLKSISCLKDPDFDIVSKAVMNEKEMFEYVSGFLCKAIYFLTKMVGVKRTCQLIRMIKA